jgi:quinol monooxygenase YgiN
MANAPVTVIAHVRAKPDQIAALRDVLLGLVRPSRADAGCLGYDLHQSAEDPSRFVFYENWTSKELLDAHLAQPHLKSFLAQIDRWLAEPPQITLWTKLS